MAKFLAYWYCICIFSFPWFNPSLILSKQNSNNVNSISNHCTNYQTQFVGFCLNLSLICCFLTVCRKWLDFFESRERQSSHQMDKISGCNCEDVSTRHNARALALNQRLRFLDAFKSFRSQPFVVRCILFRRHFAAWLCWYQNRPITTLPFSRPSQNQVTEIDCTMHVVKTVLYLMYVGVGVMGL